MSLLVVAEQMFDRCTRRGESYAQSYCLVRNEADALEEGGAALAELARRRKRASLRGHE